MPLLAKSVHTLVRQPSSDVRMRDTPENPLARETDTRVASSQRSLPMRTFQEHAPQLSSYRK